MPDIYSSAPVAIAVYDRPSKRHSWRLVSTCRPDILDIFRVFLASYIPARAHWKDPQWKVTILKLERSDHGGSYILPASLPKCFRF